MGKKHKKINTSVQLSLKDRLSIQWKNQNWLGFVELYYRDRVRSDSCLWAPYLQDGLYNALTKAIIEASEISTVTDLTNKLIKEANGPDAAQLRKCALVAQALATNVKPDDFPIEQEIALLPEPYRTIGKELTRKKPGRPSKITTPAVDISQKIGQYFTKLATAKSISPYNSLLKYCKELEGFTTSPANLEFVQAISHIATLIRQLKLSSSRGYDFSDLSSVHKHPSFKALGVRQANPILIAFWALFCRLGQDKFGEEWSNGARTLALLFMPDLNNELSGFYKGFISSYEKEHNSKFNIFNFLSFMRFMGWNKSRLESIEFFIQKGQWIEQELYILHVLLLMELSEDDTREDEQSYKKKIMTSFSKLTEIGQKYRNGIAIWPKNILKKFERGIVFNFSEDMLDSLPNISLPWLQFSVPLSLAILFYNKVLCNKVSQGSIKTVNLNPLTESNRAETVKMITQRRYPANTGLLNLKKVISQDDFELFYTDWVIKIVNNTAVKLLNNTLDKYNDFSFMDEDMENISNISDWDDFDSNCLNIGRIQGPKIGFIKSFIDIIDILNIKKSYINEIKITNNQEKLNIFFNELPNGPYHFAINMLAMAYRYIYYEDNFFIRLINVALNQAIQTDSLDYLLICVLSMHDKDARKEAADLICDSLNDENSGLSQENRSYQIKFNKIVKGDIRSLSRDSIISTLTKWINLKSL
jgi:hypothetical protein